MQEQQQQSGKRGSRAPVKQERFGALEEEGDDDDDDDDDDVDENDPEMQEFLSEVDDLFTLEPDEFERKMQTFDKRHPSTRRADSSAADEDDDEDGEDASDDDAESYDYDDEDGDDEGIERATERISKKKLLKVLDDLQPGGSSRSGKNSESMALPSTSSYCLVAVVCMASCPDAHVRTTIDRSVLTPTPETKNSAPLEKKPKKVNVERISYRQERIELSVTDFVQTLILQESDSNGTDVVASIVEVRTALRVYSIECARD